MSGVISLSPAEPLPQCAQWSEQLARLSSQPLEFAADFPEIAQRFEAWWTQGATDRPVFIGSGNADPERPIDRRLELIDDADAWLQAKLADVRQTKDVGDSVPYIRVDFGPASLAAMVGGIRVVGADTAWTEPYISDDWSNAADWTLSEHNTWWQRLQQLTRLVAADAAGRYLVCAPDIGGASDALLSMRGAAELCMDTLEQPERIHRAMDVLYPLWRRVITEFYQAALEYDAGPIQWLQLWSNLPYVVMTCDINYMLSPQQFNDVYLPDIDRLSRSISRSVFHVDGPQAAKHVDALIELPDLDAIQFTPGAATPSALPWIDMFRKIQAAGKSVIVICPLGETVELLTSLAPEGAAVITSGTPDALDAAFAELGRRYR